ncbi:hypothetical protein FB446DRAFT_788857 [Lentinula raphanica]|nr:hypothetical protein FB446DRAFT_788857 [Lentinula raphanica]
MRPSAAAPKTRKGSVDFLAGAFANIASVPEGREFFGTPIRSTPLRFENGKGAEGVKYPLAHLLPFIDHPNVIRRGGMVSTIRNFSFNPRAHRALLSPSTTLVSITSPSSSSSSSSSPTQIPASAPGLSALPLLLLPLSSSSLTDLDLDLLPSALQLLPADKMPEPDREIRKMLIETLLLLCHTRWGRGVLRGEKRVVHGNSDAIVGGDASEGGGDAGGEEAGEWYGGTYHVVRALHETETDEEIAGLIERLVVLLKGEEGHEDEEEKEYDTLTGGDDLVPPEARLLQGLVSPISGKVTSQIQTVDVEKEEEEEEEEEMSLEPLGADSSVPLSDEDSDDDKIIEI